jgi:glycosyltransferase involved in cell wall biosynthesis
MISDPRLKINGWSNDFKTIYGSFDVLIFPSRFETFGLVVFEAISAGKVCVLSDIPVFRELFEEYNNVYFLTGEKQNDIHIVNNALSHVKSHIDQFDFDPSAYNLKRAAEWEVRLQTIMYANG